MSPRTVPSKLATPSGRLVQKYWDTYRNQPRLRPGSEAVRAVFKAFPHNKSEAHIRLKAAVLNDVYSTNIVDTGHISRHIVGLRIDRRLRRHDHRLVNDIADVPRSGGPRRAYSFASKYCALHEPNGFAIYDSFVDRLLWEYQRRDKFSEFKRKDLKDYPVFMTILDDFRQHYGLGRFALRKLDKFLWLYGKDMFKTRGRITKRSI